MDDQFKRRDDDLFGFRYSEDRSREKQPEENGAREAQAERIEVGEGSDYRSRVAGREDEGANPEETTYTYGPFGSASGSGYGASDNGGHNLPSNREYRPFTVSGGGRNWENPPRRRSPLRAMFASFLAGVVVVGALMFASDHYNWFSDTALANNAGPVQTSNAKAVSNSVNNAVDTVRPNNISKIFEQASPAVVKIETYQNVQSNSGGNSLFNDPFFRQFFGDDYGGGGSGNGSNGGGSDDNLQETGMGSGFIFDSTGYILTNEHVIDGAAQVKVTVNGYEEPFTAEVLGKSFDLDLAVLKIEGSNFPTLKLGDSNAMNMGDWVVAIGNPYGFDHTVTVGVLSSNEREISIQDTNGTRNYEHLLQTDASINPGNSGGPLLNLNGEVIGINTAVSSEAQGIGFAIPTSTISEVLENLKTNTEIPAKPSPFIGATLGDLTQGLARQLGLSSTNGAYVNSVLFGSPAYKGDLRQYDVITGIDGKSYKSSQELIDVIQSKNVGDKITLNIVRAGKKMDLTVEIGDKNQFEKEQQQQQQQ
ncbi:trypsin-like peptidase domain-containing protein [Cohnella lubricantis]|uniref:Trypsin-like peptidase domain-containing protein n=1 Tax=Cohnella lubricantis TaxID=2163172 RepID=A0A841TI36_9BACL|nr:trypsin-like peptidase domain-containing protein [Cohnella lubricantis]MBB6678131.1 trypsin-like peptidase domain-containing protein [Cohnella lubricantis]MBP2116696.1 S1-C subfamily serine protease [Cohnella lubricantis]